MLFRPHERQKLVYTGAPSVFLFLVGILQDLTSSCLKVIQTLIFFKCYTGLSVPKTKYWKCFARSKMMMIMMMNCFCGMVDREKRFSLISSRDHCQKSPPSRISDTLRAGFEPAQNLSLAFVE